MTTNAYAAKRALFDRLRGMAATPGGPLSGLQVSYSWPGDMKMTCIYGGGVTFDQPGDDDAHDGVRRLVKETAQVAVHIRVYVTPPPPDGIEDTDEQAEAIGEAIGEALAANPGLAGGNSVTRISGGQGDYSALDAAAVSTLSYRITVESHFEQ